MTALSDVDDLSLPTMLGTSERDEDPEDDTDAVAPERDHDAAPRIQATHAGNN